MIKLIILCRNYNKRGPLSRGSNNTWFFSLNSAFQKSSFPVSTWHLSNATLLVVYWKRWHTHTQKHTQSQIGTPNHTHTTHPHTHTHTQTGSQLSVVYSDVPPKQQHTHTQTHTHTHTHPHTPIHTHTPIPTNTYKHTHTHTHRQTNTVAVNILVDWPYWPMCVCAHAINPINAEKVFFYLCWIYSFYKQMLSTANTDLFNRLVNKAHNSECQNLLFPVIIKPVKVSETGGWIFIFCILGTNGLIQKHRLKRRTYKHTLMEVMQTYINIYIHIQTDKYKYIHIEIDLYIREGRAEGNLEK